MTVKKSKAVSHKNGHDWCLLCGRKNPRSLKLEFHADDDGVKTDFQPRQILQGYHGILHGGVIAALLDAAMTHCLFHHGVQAVTGDLHVRYLHLVSCRTTLELKARILSAVPPLYRLRAELMKGKQLMAWAEAKFMQHEHIHEHEASLYNDTDR